MNYLIKNVSSKQELEKTLDLFKVIFKGKPVITNPEYTFEKWEGRMNTYGDLMFYASYENEVIGFVLGRMNDNNTITVAAVGMHEDHRGTGLAKKMMLMMEERAKHYGVKSISLGAVESAERFYNKLGYKGSLLIQSQVHTIEELLSLKNKYEVEFTNIYDGKVSQLCLKLSQANRELQREYENTLKGCYTQMMYSKEVH